MKKTVYIETSIISYLAAKKSRDFKSDTWQQITRQWWEQSRKNYDLFTSTLVFIESRRGDLKAAEQRIACLTNIPVLTIDAEVENLANKLLLKGGLPSRAAIDALHVAVATVHEIDYLLTWNCRHIDNAAIKPLMRSVCIIENYHLPEICTPMELFPEETDYVPR